MSTWSCAVALSMSFAAPSSSSEGTSAFEGNAVAGEEGYAGCAVCHGPDGSGRADGTFPRLAGQHASVVYKQIQDMRAGRRGNPIMSTHLDLLTDEQEIADIAAYIERLPALPAPPPGEAPLPDVARDGGALFARDCVRCHGAKGEGNSAARIPVVAGQHSAYLLRQLRAIAGSLRRNAHPEMVEAIFDYRDEELRAVASYLASLPWPERPGEP